MKLSPSIEALIEALRCLPSVGPKSAQRMTLHLLERDRQGAAKLAEAIKVALSGYSAASAAEIFPSSMSVSSAVTASVTTVCYVS